MTFIIGLGIGQFWSCPGQAISSYSLLPTTPTGARDMYKGRITLKTKALLENTKFRKCSLYDS